MKRSQPTIIRCTLAAVLLASRRVCLPRARGIDIITDIATRLLRRHTFLRQVAILSSE